MRPKNLWRALGPILLIAALLPVLSVPAPSAQAGGGSGGGSLMHDSLDDLYRTPLGAVPTGTTVTLRFSTAGGVDSVTLRVWDAFAQKEQMLPMGIVATTPEGYDFWETTLDVGKQPTIYWYRFILTKGGETIYYEDNTRLGEDGAYFPADEGGSGIGYDSSPDLSWQIAVYDPDYYTPEWMRDAVIYQIFPDRFRDGDPSNDPTDDELEFYDGLKSIFHETWNEPPIDPRQPGEYEERWGVDFFGGDLAGITEKLDYLQELGVTAIYLNPIFAARSNHRYDTTDFKEIDPLLGTREDFDTLVAEAQKRGMVIILDGVFNHLSSDSPFFDRYNRYEVDGACESLDSPYRNWFFFIPPKGQQASACVDNPQGATYYTSWAGFDSIPKINNDNGGPRLYFYQGRNSVVNTWSAIGGWRLDVGGDIDDGPGSDYWEGFRVAVRNANPEGVIIGEEWGNATKWLLGKEWDSVMNYRLRTGILGFARDEDYMDNDANGDRVIYALTPTQLDRLIRDIESDYPPVAYFAMMNILGSHDTSRLLFVAGDTERQKLAALLQFALPGAPTIYYGDEIALNAPSVDDNGTVQDDPYNRAPYPWPDTAGNAYGPPDQDMLAHYQTLAALRHANPALRQGEMITLATDDAKGVYAFARVDEAAGNMAIVVLNKSDQEQTVELPYVDLPAGLAFEAAFGNGDLALDALALQVRINARSGDIWTATADAPFIAPEPPQNLVAQGENGGVILTWDPAPDAAAYVVYRSPVAVGGFEPVSGYLSEPGFIDESTTNGYRYYYAVASLNNDLLIGDQGPSAPAIPSAPIAATYYLMDDAPSQVTLAYGLTVTIRAAVSIAGETEQDGFAPGVRAEAALLPAGGDLAAAEWMPMFYKGENNGADAYEATIPLTAAGEFVQVARFSSNAGETWTVVITPDGAYPPLTVLAPDDTDAPAPPASASILQASLAGVIVTWDGSPSEDVAAYRVYRASGNESSLVGEVTAGGENRYHDKAVSTGSRYSYSVAAVDTALNESEAASAGEATVEQRGIPVTFIVTVPDYTSQGEGDVTIAGDFGTKELPLWDPAGIAMTKVDDRHWTVTLELPEGAKLQYKYARGTWDAVEKGVECEEIANRQMTVELPVGATDLIVDGDIVAKWRDLDKCG
jgi:glycosidase